MTKPLGQHERRQALKERFADNSVRPGHSELAAEMGVSERTIFRDLAAIGVSTHAAARRSLAVTGGEVPFVGRSVELEQLQAAQQQALVGHGGVTLITGEPGGGKSRLISEFRTGLKSESVVASFRWSQIGAAVLTEPLYLSPPGRFAIAHQGD